MNATPFTVVIPLYNKVNSICRTLASIEKQRLKPKEVIVIDDGSTDGSSEKVAAYDMNNLRLVIQKNQGVSAARNLGAKYATTKYIAFLDADDQWSPFYLEEMDRLIKRFPRHHFFASNYQKVMGDGDFLDPKLATGCLPPTGCIMNNYFDVASRGDLPFMPSSCVVSRSLFNRLKGFPVGEPMGEDQALFSQIALKESMVYTPLVLMLYHTDAENRACDRHVPDDLLPFAKRLLLRVSNSAMDSNQVIAIKRYCAAHACHLAKINIQVGNLRVARRLLQLNICQFKPLHRFVLRAMTVVKSLQFNVTNLFLKSRQAH